MDDEFDMLEAELRRAVRPKPLPSAVRERIAAELATVTLPVRAWWTSAWLKAAAAVLVGLAAWSLWLHYRQGGSRENAAVSVASAEAPRPTVFAPSAAHSVLLREHDDGVVTLGDTRPVRRITHDVMDHMEWQSMGGRQRYIVDRPRKEVMFVSLDTY